MYFVHTALTAASIIVLVNGQRRNTGSNENAEELSEEKSDSILSINHTFVALIDIVFTDNTKRTCTGAIVHENVIITAAHCFFGKDKQSNSKPELTASFVVIGTKKMFDTGYEQYLPIERIVVHPKYEGWTADLALVFTFAGMTSDKPGTVIPLAGEKTTAHLDSNVTVFSWGHSRSYVTESIESLSGPKKFEKYNKHENDQTAASDESCASDVEDEKSRSTNKPMTKRHTAAMAGKRFRNEQDEFTSLPTYRFKKKNNSPLHRRDKHKNRHERAQVNSGKEILEDGEKRTSSRYLTVVVDRTENIESSISPYTFGRNEPNERIEKQSKVYRHAKKKKESTTPSETALRDKSLQDDDFTHGKKKKISRILYSFKSSNGWRRSMGSQQNRLLVENFGFVNLHACRALVDKALPPKYNISKYNDVICYTNVDRCVDERDSGAPAVRQGQLMAVTIGGAECEGDQVAVGMRMACYCSWISDNLPPGSTSLSCCKNCCDVKHKDDKKKEKRHRFRNRFI